MKNKNETKNKKSLYLIVIKIGIVFLKFIYFILKLLPTRKRIVFISRQSNTPTIDIITLKDYLEKNLAGYKIKVLTKRLDKGINAKFSDKLKYAFNMLAQMYYLATSRVVILDSYCMSVSLLKHKKKLLVIQMWHAIGSMKKFGYAMIDKKEGSPREVAELMNMHKNYDYALISSFSFIKDYLEGFNIDKNKILEIPLPKVDLLTDDKYKCEKKKEMLNKYPELKKKKNILYCPTFRKNEMAHNKALDELIKYVDFKKYNLIVSPHPLSKKRSFPKEVIVNKNSSFDMLFVADYVISDYSSIIYEAGLLKIPFCHYAYDWDKYKHGRELNLDLEKESPGIFTKDPKKIIDFIEKERFNKKKYEEFIDKNVAVTKESCCSKICNLIKKYL